MTTTDADLKTPDASPETWVDRAPGALRPHLRLMRADRPVGVWLLFWPCVWGMLLARPDGFDAKRFWLLVLFYLVGAFVMRSAGCVYNDIVDRDIDAKVARTANRPIAAGRVSVKAAIGLVVGLSLIGLLVLLQLSGAAILVGLGALGLVAAYPFMKRITWWPQAWLGLTFNWGVLVGAASVSGGISLSALLLYAAGIAWTFGYDTIYAHQDREDDALVGVKSSARKLGTKTKPALIVTYGAVVLLALAALTLKGAAGFWWLMLPAAGHLAWQIVSLDVNDGGRCLTLFKANVWTGALIALPFIAA